MWNITGDGVANFKSGTFSGSLYGANITGTNGTFSGVLSAGSVDFTTSVGTTTTYNTAGTFAITVPANMTSMRINLMGGGGGGGAGGSYSNTGGGQGGFGSVLTIITLNGLTAGTGYTLVVGSGGTAGVNYVYPFGDTTYSDSYYETPTITQSTSGITSSLSSCRIAIHIHCDFGWWIRWISVLRRITVHRSHRNAYRNVWNG